MHKFISRDGIDPNDGSRAEVAVTVDTAKILSINPNGKGQVEIRLQSTNEKLKHPAHGWLSEDDPIMDIARQAQVEGKPVEFRIESQRKKGVDRSIPMDELRKSTESARDNTKVILAGLNGTPSNEALTHPSEDPAAPTFGRNRATGLEGAAEGAATPAANTGGTGSTVTAEKALEILSQVASANVTQDLVTAVAAQAIIAGATIEEVHQATAGEDRKSDDKPAERAGFATEAPQWKRYNSDGKPNLGSLYFGSGTATEKFVHGKLAHLISEDSNWEYKETPGAFNETVTYFAQNIIAIADAVQVGAYNVYGEGFRVDRSASSHTRVRDIVFTTIDRLYPIPVTEDGTYPDAAEVKAWVARVGTTSRERFAAALELASSTSRFGEIVAPTFATAKVEEAQPAEDADETRNAPQSDRVAKAKLLAGAVTA